jgi:hypothetical protein
MYAGPIQEIELSCDRETDIKVERIERNKKETVIDFVARIRETKTIYAETERPIINFSFLDDVKGTILINDGKLKDILLDIYNETI